MLRALDRDLAGDQRTEQCVPKSREGLRLPLERELLVGQRAKRRRKSAA